MSTTITLTATGTEWSDDEDKTQLLSASECLRYFGDTALSMPKAESRPGILQRLLKGLRALVG